jgi:hypothetical protein
MATAAEISALYNKYLGRDPLQGGLDYWLGTGQTIQEIEYNISVSREAQVVDAFKENAGRLPDNDERQFLVNEQPQADIGAFVGQVAEEEGYDPLADTIDDDTTADDTTAGGSSTPDDGERLYDYTNQREDGGSQNLYWNNYSREVTASELQELYNAPDNARLRESFGTFDNYLAYMDERQDLIEAGDYKADWWDTGVALVDVEGLGREGGQDDRALEMDIMQEGARQGEIGYNQQADLFNSLYEKYTGESTTKYLDNGAKYEWNGTSFVLTQEAFGPSLGSIVGAALPGLILSAGLAGPLAGVLQGAGLSGSAATAASQAIINGATQLATTGNLDIKQALVSGAIAYGGAELGEIIRGSTELDGVLGDIASAAKDTANTLQELVETGIPIADAAIQAGGISMLTQLVTTGDIDLKQAALSAVLAGGKEAFTQFNEFMAQSGVSSDSYMNDLAEMEEFQQAAIDADIKDPFLNPNYQTVGDGSVVLNTVTNEVFSVTDNKSLGQFSELDSNSDGILDSNDLSFVDVTATKVDDPFMGYEMGDNIIVTTDGTTLPKGSVLVATRDGGYYSYDADGNRVDVTLQRYNEVFGGGKGELVWNSEGGTEGTINYENGELAYQKVEGQWQDAQGNIVDDPQLVDELTLIAAKAIDEPLQSITYYDQDGNPISYNYPSYNLRDSYESGQYSGTIFGKDGRRYEWDSTTGLYKYSPETADPSYTQDVWYDPSTGTEYVKVDDKITINKVDIENIIDPMETQQTTNQQQQQTTTNVTEASENLTTQLTNATSSQEAIEAVNTAAAFGLSAAQIATLVSEALSGGSINSETASAASNAVEALTKSTDVSKVNVTTGDVATVTGGGDSNGGNNINGGGTDVTPKKDLGTGSGVLGGISGMLTGMQNVDKTPSGGDTGDVKKSGTGNVISTIGGLLGSAIGQVGGGVTTNGGGDSGGDSNGGDGDDPPVDPPSETKFPAAGTYAGGYCQTRGENGGTLVSIKHDGKGGTYQEESFSASCKTTTSTPNPGPGKTPNGGPGPGPGPGLGVGLLLGATGGGQAPALREFTPAPGKDIRIQAPEMLPDIVGRQQDAVAQLMRAISAPYATKPSGQQLNGLFERILQDQEKIA